MHINKKYFLRSMSIIFNATLKELSNNTYLCGSSRVDGLRMDNRSPWMQGAKFQLH